jgi:hypothetical protein
MAAVAPETYAARKAAEERKRYSHAFPDGSDIALCGVLKTGEGMPVSERCPKCLDASRQRSWVAR